LPSPFDQGFSAEEVNEAAQQLPGNQAIAAGFHVFSINWEPQRITFFVDGDRYLSATPASLPPGGQWVFDQNPMYILLNLAVGGSPAPVGYPDITTTFPQQMVVDYVRVYQHVPLNRSVPVVRRERLLMAPF